MTDLTVSNIENITFGVEIETNIPSNSTIQVGMHGCGHPIPQAPKFEGGMWKADGDPSIHGSGRACEFVSPVLKGQAGVQHLIEFVAWANAQGAQVNPSCGVHIHVGVQSYVPNYAPAEVAEFVNKVTHVTGFYSTALYAQTGTVNRENGRWCAKPGSSYKNMVRGVNKSKDLAPLRTCNGLGRYQLLNVCNVATGRRTLEFRCFAGTLNIEKLLVHLFSVLTICRIASQLKTVPAWEAKNVTGQEAVWNLLSRQSHRRASCPQFAEHWRAMVDIALQMATKYDSQKQGQHPTPPSV